MAGDRLFPRLPRSLAEVRSGNAHERNLYVTERAEFLARAFQGRCRELGQPVHDKVTLTAVFRNLIDKGVLK